MKTAKQVLIVRKDLKMRRGKECSQCSHASLGAILKCMAYSRNKDKVTMELTYSVDSAIGAWLEGPFTKITVYVNSEEELVSLQTKAREAGLIHCLITDSGKTEFNNISTKTVLAIGPNWEEDINPITGHLPLY